MSVSETGAPHFDLIPKQDSSNGINLANKPMIVPASDDTSTIKLNAEVVVATLRSDE